MDGSTGVRDAKYQSALEFLYGRINYERTARGVPSGSILNLDRMRLLLDELRNPQDSLPAIHIAGTKGKGSTAAVIAASLIAAGYRTGVYTSPHLERLEERISVDGVNCTPAELIELVDAVRPVVAKLDLDAQRDDLLGEPTFFEITTAMAMLHFADRNVEAAVLEVGLGGRLDSTNICRPVVTVITSISFDHVQQLGRTLHEIAREKAGIVKTGVPLVCGVTEDDSLNAIRSIAIDRSAPLHLLRKDFDYQYTASPRDSITGASGFINYRDSLSKEETRLDVVNLGMLGLHQAANSAIAIATLRRLQTDGWEIPEAAIREGVAAARCSARVEVVSRHPLVILDTAHNVASIDALLSVVDESFSNEHRTLIFAATRDKDVSGMLRQLLPRFERVILTRYVDNPRSVPPERLMKLIDKLRDKVSCKPEVHLCESPAVAWQKCQAITAPDHLICVTGSFFLAAEMRPIIEGNQPLRVG